VTTVPAEVDFWNSSGFLYAILSSAALVGVIVLVLTEVVKDWLFVRNGTNALILWWWRSWLSRSLLRVPPVSPSQIVEDLVWLGRLAGPLGLDTATITNLRDQARAAPDDDIQAAIRSASRGSRAYRPNQLVRSLELLGKQILERPRTNPGLFRLLSFGAIPRDLLVVMAADYLRTSPSAKLLAEDSPAATAFKQAVQAAQDSVSLQMDRNLDELQLWLTSAWNRTLRLTSLVLSVATVFAVLRVEDGAAGILSLSLKDIFIAVSIALIGSYLSSFLYDLLRLVGSLAGPR
jgi:hypothetical protein